MGIGFSMQLSSFRPHALDCFIAACEADPPSLLGQGVVTKIANAFQPGWVVQNSHTINDMLFNACCSGSWVAAEDLAKRCPSRAKEARRIHRTNGGYNAERLDTFQSEKGPKGFQRQGNLMSISLASIQCMRLVEFAPFSSAQLCRDWVDTNKNTLLHIAAMLGRVDSIRT